MNTLFRNLWIIVGIFLTNIAYSQEDYTFWNKIHNWDGITSWTQYLKYSSKYMGPNSLPVPYNIGGSAGDSTFVELNTAYHYYTGDQTNDLGYNVHFNFLKDFVSMEMYGVGIEHYRMDTATRDQRASRNRNPEGSAWGDVNFNFIIQILKQPRFADLALRINLKTASGQKMEEARYTDGPAYFFDLSAGKTFKTSIRGINKIKLKAYAGFYCWQTMITQQRQSDAYMYSVGADFYFNKKIWILNEISGYTGSLNTGDKPLIVRSKVFLSLKNKGLYLEYYSGFKDYLYHSIRCGLQLQINHLR